MDALETERGRSQSGEGGRTLDSERQARGRARAYALFGRLIGGGASASRELEAAAAAPAIGAAIATYRGDLEALAADHEHVFGLSCPPFESAMLDPEGVLGNETSDRVREALASAGIAEGPQGQEPDHLATQLYALALLSGAEADALEDRQQAEVERMRSKARSLLDAHLLRWLPVYAAAVRRAGRPWPAALVHAIEELALMHRSTLGPAVAGDVALELPPIGASLAEEGTGLADIARVLARPARAGLLLSRDDVARLGRSSATPRGFGDRATLIENLLRAGAQLGSLREVLGALSDLMAEAQGDLAAERLADVPAALRSPWQRRLDETRALLATMREAYRDSE